MPSKLSEIDDIAIKYCKEHPVGIGQGVVENMTSNPIDDLVEAIEAEYGKELIDGARVAYARTYAEEIVPGMITADKIAAGEIQGVTPIAGAAWTKEGMIIAALVRKLGGHVTLSPAELFPRGGLLITPNSDESIELTIHGPEI